MSIEKNDVNLETVHRRIPRFAGSWWRRGNDLICLFYLNVIQFRILNLEIVAKTFKVCWWLVEKGQGSLRFCGETSNEFIESLYFLMMKKILSERTFHTYSIFAIEFHQQKVTIHWALFST